MFLIELFLPLDRGDATAVPSEEIEDVVSKLAARFGGATAFTRTPAKGLWEKDSALVEDRIVIVEVMTDVLDESFWADYRSRLEGEFQQEHILIRASRCQIH